MMLGMVWIARQSKSSSTLLQLCLDHLGQESSSWRIIESREVSGEWGTRRNRVCITTTTNLVPQADQFRIPAMRVPNSKHKVFSSKTLPAAQHSTQNSARNKRRSVHQAKCEGPSAPKHLHKPSKKHQWDK
jgi:hypothetical protein